MMTPLNHPTLRKVFLSHPYNPYFYWGFLSQRELLEIQQTAWLTQQVRQQATVQAGVAAARWHLTHPDTDQRWQADGQPHRFRWEDQDLSLSIRSEQARIDLNLAPRSLLQGLLQQILPMQPTEQLADALLDWRDADQLTRQGGTESARHAPDTPNNRPFFSVAELAHVTGFDTDSVAALTPFLTVHARRARIDPRSAELPVIAALPGLLPGQAEQFVQHREHALASGRRVDFSLLSPARNWIDRQTHPAVLSVRVQLPSVTDRPYQAEVIIPASQQRRAAD